MITMSDSMKKVASDRKKQQPKEAIQGHATVEQFALSKIELSIYVTIYIFFIVYGSYNVFQTSKENEHQLNLQEPTWKVLNRNKDVSNHEWQFYRGWFPKFAPFFISHVVLSKVYDWIFPAKNKLYFYMIHSLLAISTIYGVFQLALMLIYALAHYLISTYTVSKTLVWVVNLMSIATLNYSPFTDYMMTWIPHRRQYYLYNFSVAMLLIKFLSFSLEQCDQRYNKKPAFSLTEMISYAFYLPLLVLGPHITFHQFHTECNEPKRGITKKEYFNHAVTFLRLLFWAIFMEVFLHFMYINAISEVYSLMDNVPLWSLATIGFWQGQSFQMKYVVYFGLPSIMARLDQFHPPEKGPVCISTVYKYSRMWRNFDRGLHLMIKRHIYVPLGGSRHGIWWLLLASGASFLYIGFWHGGIQYIFFWIMINFVSVGLESIGGIITSKAAYTKFKADHLNCEAWHHIESLCIMPVFMMSAFAIFYFFNGMATGDIFVKRLLTGYPLVVVLLSFYCSIQTCKALEARSTKKKTG